MIEKVAIKGFRSAREVSIEFEKLTVLVGPNAAGKSTILDALRFVARLRDPLSDEDLRKLHHYRAGWFLPLLEASGGWETIHTRPDGGPCSVRVDRHGGSIEFGTEPPEADRNWYDASFWLVGDGRVDASIRICDRDNSWNTRIGDRQEPAHFQNALTSQAFKLLINEFPQTLRVQPDAKAAIAPCPPPTSETHTMESDGRGLPALLSLWASQRADALNDFERDLKRLVPVVEKVIPVPTTLQNGGNASQEPGVRLDAQITGIGRIPGRLLSEGTVISMVILAAIHAAGDGDQLILIDDIDHGLHPVAQAELVKCLRGIVEAEDKDRQIICTTHSPYLVDHFDFHEVRLVTLGLDRYTHVQRMDAHPDFEKYKDVLGTGEFWSAVGEDWAAPQQPGE